MTGAIWMLAAALAGFGAGLQAYAFWRISRLVAENRRLEQRAADIAAAVRRDTHAMTQLIALAISLKLLIRSSQVGLELTTWDPPGCCPDCGHPQLELGPRDGASVNLTCAACGQKWNTIPQMRLIQRI